MSNYDTFKKFLTTYVERDGIQEFVKWLDTTDFATAPASTKYHLSCEGGLVQHSINVFYRLIRLINDELGSDQTVYSKDTIALVALLHDVSKADFYTIEYRNKKNANGDWEKVPYFAVKSEDSRYIMGNHMENSLFKLCEYFDLTYEEQLAILHHMGGLDICDNNVSAGNTAAAFKKSKLALLLHLADMQATYIDEVKSIENE